MKKIIIALIILFIFSFKTNLRAQEILVKNIPVYFMSGEYHLPIVLADLIEYQDDVNKSMLDTYLLLSHAMFGLKFPDGLIEKNLTEIEEIFGKESTLYGLALIPKAVAAEEDLDILVEAAQIIKEAEGETSWEYAFALMYCANVTLDIKKYGSIDKSLGYIKMCLDVLEKGQHKSTWLYPMALCNRGAAKLYKEDETFVDDMTTAYEILDSKDEYLSPLIFATIFLASTYTILQLPDYAIEIINSVMPFFDEFDLSVSETYISLNTTLCYAYLLKKEKKTAQTYFEKAESACIALFGKDSPRYKSLDTYRKML